MGMTARGGFSGDRFRKVAAALPAWISEEMREAGEDGKREGQKVIQTAGSTTKTGKAGRIETGNMLRSVDYRLGGNATSRRVDVGWTMNYEDYFGYQEEGTRYIAAMGMLSHLEFFLSRRIDEALDNILRRMDDGL